MGAGRYAGFTSASGGSVTEDVPRATARTAAATAGATLGSKTLGTMTLGLIP